MADEKTTFEYNTGYSGGAITTAGTAATQPPPYPQTNTSGPSGGDPGYPPATGQPNYGVYPGAQYQAGAVTIGQQPVSVVRQEPAGPQPKNYLWCGIVLLIMCNFICGGIALALSLMSQSEWRQGREKAAKDYAKAACCVGACGFTLEVIAIIIVIVYVILLATGVIVGARTYSYSRWSTG